ncbi:hypothetical protein [Yinghuangia soli]|uniref:Uncharacterized protein n=1 Tax=Yinghuangia soli TaxID=2908204 RepID=A0AA41Q701_9ACTN|nr:hypothetical protein [Yinghuangia soli]MCF2532100.1 hypothetical protein [Yinghuangia soli]
MRLDRDPGSPEADQTYWEYKALERVGPLHFGMLPETAVAAMYEAGFVCGSFERLGDFGLLPQTRTRFRRAGRPMHQTDVDAFYIDAALTCVAVDAGTGPRVTFDGMELIGRPAMDLQRELIGYLERTDREIRLSPDGVISADDLGILTLPQQVGELDLSRAIFSRTHYWANTMFDTIPGAALYLR